jgi:hypothetical protein
MKKSLPSQQMSNDGGRLDRSGDLSPPLFRIGPGGRLIPVTGDPSERTAARRPDRQGKRLIGTHVPSERYQHFKVVAALLGLNTDKAVNRALDLLFKEAEERGHQNPAATRDSRREGNNPSGDSN